jgi:hypothetical protein
MKRIAMIAGAGLVALGSIGPATAQPNPIQGTPGSLFPYAAPHEVMTVDGMACRTVHDSTTNSRVPVACVDMGSIGSVDGASQ